MKDRETELLDRWRAERSIYEAWGAFVSDRLQSAVAREISPAQIDVFLRMPVSPRIKEEKSLLAKAFHRGKAYTDPYGEIEDKVGVRCVVLFSREIRVIESAIVSCEQWTAEKARDFEEERDLRPYEFDYQSLHYVVRSKPNLRYGDVEIPTGTPCEIQVRTLLQHAYSELTHDTIYKPSIRADAGMKRAAAKSMALIEATDDYFAEVARRLAEAQAPGQRIADTAERLYPEFTKLKPDISSLNALLVDYYKQWTREGFEAELSAFLQEKSYIADCIRERAPVALLYRQPAILLVYWVITQAPRAAAGTASPLSDDELALLYSDLGARLPDTRP